MNKIQMGIAILLLASSLSAAEYKVLIAEDGRYSTDVVVATQTGGTVVAGNCLNKQERELVAKGSTKYRNLGLTTCGAPIRLHAIEAPADAQVSSVIDATIDGRYTSFVVPAVTGKITKNAAEVGPIEGDNERITTLAVFNDGTASASLVVEAYDAQNKQVATDRFFAPVGFSFHRVASVAGTGYVRVSQGNSGFGCVGCNEAQPVYGFVLVDSILGGAPRFLEVKGAE